ncbi:MAG: hypothetical protein EZS28_036157 [Streblomastix strix]|uniref:Tyr recombinase domain-containing protein n=1 Tax=Streblomastix strix TaxID=222440 RepID=A0A5J4UBX5_9EUKA|nr:MAG: hypothetical protein EZS28_036157 [Streblomastix strix]
MEQGTEEVDKQQEGDGSHILRSIPLRISLQRAADQSDPHQVRMLYRSIRFSKTKSRIKLSCGSEENSQAMSTTENTNTDSTNSGSFKQDNRRTMQVKYPGRLFSKERDFHSPVLSVVDNTNTGLVRIRGKQTRGQIRGNRRGRGRGRVVECIFQTMERGDLLDPPTNSENWKSPDRLGEVQTQINHDSTLVARSNMVHVLTNRQQQIPYSWRELSDSEPWEGDDQEEGHVTTRKDRDIPHGPRVEQGRRILTEFLDNINMTRETQKMIIEGQKFNTQKKYMQTMGVFEDWMKEKNYTVQDIMNQKIPFIHTEFMTWLTRTRKTKPSSARSPQQCRDSPHTQFLIIRLTIQDMGAPGTLINCLSIGERDQKANSSQMKNYKQNQLHYQCRYALQEWKRWQTQIYQYRSQMIKNKELQFAFHPNNLGEERYDVRKTEEPKVCPTETFFVWLTRLREHFYQSPTNFIHLFWTENWKRADQRYISTRLERLVQTLGVQNATANSIRHASSTELAAQVFDRRTINVYTHHTPDSKMNKEQYIFAVNKEQDSIASALVKNHGMKQATQIISKQRGDARVSDGDELQYCPQGDDQQLFPQETLASPLSLPIISSQSIVEAESPNDHESAKAQNSQIQKDDQDVKLQEEAQNSNMTKDSDRAATAGDQK